MISRYHNEAKKIYGNYYKHVIPCVKMYVIYVYNQSLIDLLLTRNSCLSLPPSLSPSFTIISLPKTLLSLAKITSDC